MNYAHTQNSPLCLLLYGSALLCLVITLVAGGMPGMLIGGAVGLFIACLAPAFHHLRVVDQGERLALQFGPLPLFRRGVAYDDIDKVDLGRTLILDGWGIHYSIRGGWVWNIWGRQCVVVYFKNGDVLRIGTDDGENLAKFLTSRTRDARRS